MMKNASSFLPFLSLLATTAEAHPAIHEGGFARVLIHYLTEPDHLLMLGAAGLLGWLLLRRIRGRSS